MNIWKGSHKIVGSQWFSPKTTRAMIEDATLASTQFYIPGALLLKGSSLVFQLGNQHPFGFYTSPRGLGLAAGEGCGQVLRGLPPPGGGPARLCLPPLHRGAGHLLRDAGLREGGRAGVWVDASVRLATRLFFFFSGILKEWRR